MWLLDLVVAAEEVPAAPPAVPFETVGIVLVALVTGITGIIVALIQRGKRDNATSASTSPATQPGSTPVFVISKEDWTGLRDGVIKLAATFESFKGYYDANERRVLGELQDLDNEVARVKGHLGIQ